MDSMWLKSIRIRNFRSFDEGNTHTFDRHMNIVVGQNNVGKTAFLQAASQP
jgi:AAA15 family ATPase/GTPase